MKFVFAVLGIFLLSFGVVSALQQSAAQGDKVLQGVSKSDDYDRFNSQFQQAANNLIRRGWCNEADFIEQGGFTRSVNRPGEYFTYCGGMTTVNNRIYVNVEREPPTISR
jgi:hypothetical protein